MGLGLFTMFIKIRAHRGANIDARKKTSEIVLDTSKPPVTPKTNI